MPPAFFPYIVNCRVVQEGRVDGRPGYTALISGLPGTPNSVRRLNDPAASRYAYVGGVGTNLFVGPPTGYISVDTGYSGDPLSLIPFRPEQSPSPWMYVYDRLKNRKVKADGTVSSIGLAPPTAAPTIEYGTPATVDITTGQSASGWTAIGTDTVNAIADRTNGSTPTISSILYDSGTIGWCCISPSGVVGPWMGERMKIILSGGPETVVVREIHNAIQATTIYNIVYDSGVVGMCSIVLVNNVTGLERNSLITIDTEIVRVQEVIPSPDGTSYSLRCSTTINHIAGENVTGLLSWYVYTVNHHVAAEAITSSYISVSHSGAGVGGAKLTAGIDASTAAGRRVDPANDYLHISLFLQNPQNVTDIQLLLSLDSSPVFSFTAPGNSYIWTITQAELNTQGSIGNAWVEVVVPISGGVRSGSNLALNLSNISGIAVQITSTGACAYGFDWWYLFGTYGPTIQPNSPVGYVYQSRFRDASIGIKSVPGPQNRFYLFPLRESVIITPQTADPVAQPGVDNIDIYRQGGSITEPLYVGTVPNSPFAPESFTDTQPDSTVLAVNQPPDLGAIQPWPLLDRAWQGLVTVIGTTVIWESGTKFNVNLLSNSIIVISGVAYLTYGQPSSDTMLQITQDAGYQAHATYQIASPTLAGQPLPFAFGPLQGPFAPVIFAVGDPINGGNLYYTNPSDADSASDTNSLELSTPSSNLVSGAIWNGLACVGNRDILFWVRYSYLNSPGSALNAFQWVEMKAPSGMWSRWACCSTPIGVAYLGRDGIYIANETLAANISDAQLYPLFPHEGQAAAGYVSGSNIILPVDMTLHKFLRLTYCDEEIRFSYVDTGGNYNTLIFEIYKKRWLLNNYGHNINLHYLDETEVEGTDIEQILMVSVSDNSINLAGGNTDKTIDVNSVLLTPSLDGSDERSQKLYVDAMVQVDGTGTLNMSAAYESAQSFSPVVAVPCVGSVQQTLQNIASLADLSLHRNIGAKFAWIGGPAGPKVMAWEMSGYLMPYLSTRIVTQYFPFSFPGWKHLRRLFPALISTSDVLFTIKTQDGRTYGPFTIPSTGGQYKILPQMMSHGIKDLAFALQLESTAPFAAFQPDFTAEMKHWTEETYVDLALFRA